MLGLAKEDIREVKILNKIVRMTDLGVELEADPRHAELVVRELGLENCKPSKVPGAKAANERTEIRVIKPARQNDIMTMNKNVSEGELDRNDEEDIWERTGEGSAAQEAQHPEEKLVHAVRREGVAIETVELEKQESYRRGVHRQRPGVHRSGQLEDQAGRAPQAGRFVGWDDDI